ncbi:unnamed protein product [Peronospora belbahrii]|uniref:tRNA-intron lyase n=1 Tax=Peronospora belbahrii TaxID=622444 RepID=A0ABN8CXV3_9STRA|nr:unnamed protein product [Peronospora belbahrii]
MAKCCAVATVVVSPDPNAVYGLVHDPLHIAFLQQRCRIYGSPDGSQAAGTKAPARLRLALEEMTVGVTKGFLRLQAASDMKRREPGDRRWRLSLQRHHRLQVFQDLWERNYIVTFGSKFGADFLIYKDNPKHTHAVALITVKEYEEEFERVDIVSFCRVAKMIKKVFLFASVRDSAENKSDGEQKDGSQVSEEAVKSVVYISLTHALLVSRR